MKNFWVAFGAVLGFMGVAMGAFGAHGLEDFLNAKTGRADNFETAVRYQMYHALALVLVGVAGERLNASWLRLAGGAFFLGTLLFSGRLYAYVFTGHNTLMVIVPVGGGFLLLGWLALLLAACKAPR